MVSRPWPFETVVMAVLLEQEKRITQLLDALQALNTAHTAAAGSGRRPEDSAVSTHGRMQA